MIRRASEMPTEVREHMRGGDGQVQLTALLQPEEMLGKGRLFSTITLEPGCSIGEHQHVGEAEIFYIVQGAARITDNGAEHVLQAGDMLFTGDGDRHSVANAGNETMVMVAVILYS